MDFGKQIANRIKQLRESQGLTQEKLSEKAGMALTAFSRIERGSNSNIHVNTLHRIVSALGVDYPTFFNFTDSDIYQEKILAKLSLIKDDEELLYLIDKIIDLKLKK